MGQRPANAPYVFTTQGVFQHQPFSNWGSHLGLVTMRLTMKGSVAQTLNDLMKPSFQAETQGGKGLWVWGLSPHPMAN